MNKTAIASAVCLAASAALAGPVHAQAPSCADVVWNATAMERLPNASDYCLDVVERGGAWYAKLHAKVVRHGATSTVVRYQQAAGGWSESERTYPPSGLTADIDGQTVKISDLQPGQEVNIYVVDREYFSIPMLDSAPAPAAE